MTDWICKEVQTDNGGYLEPVKELIHCKECALWDDADSEHLVGYCTEGGGEKITFRNEWCCWAERKDEYVTLHHDDIHFIDEDAERAFYESLEERTRSFTDEEWKFYKKVNREKMQKTGLNIYDLMNKKEEE